MSLKSWLDKIKKYAPIILAETPAAPLAPYIAIGIQAAEQIPGASGPAKLEAAKQITHIVVAATNDQAGHQVVDPALVDKLADDAASTVVDAVNLKK